MDEKKTPKAKEQKDKKSFKAKLGEYKGEFAKIIWPTRPELFKSSVTVVVTCIIFGIAIFIMDLVFNRGMEFFTRLIG